MTEAVIETQNFNAALQATDVQVLLKQLFEVLIPIRNRFAATRLRQDANIIEMVEARFGKFDTLIENINYEGYRDADKSELPPQAQEGLALIKKILADQKARLHELVIGTVRQYLTDEEVAAQVAYLRSPVGQKMQSVAARLEYDLACAESKWQNDALEPHQEEIKKVFGAVPPPAEAPVDDAAPAVTSETLAPPEGAPAA